jgi:2-C-methyl-D-erythritol 4-phosphate cytidylyltransferase
MERYVIIVAGGSGKRMESSVPKQFMLLNNRPLLMHVFDVFQTFDTNIKFVLVLNPSLWIQWQNLCKEYNFTMQHQLVEGGSERYYSVKKGLEAVPKQVVVAVHDAARPLVSLQTIQRCFYYAEKHGNAVPAIEVSDSYRLLDPSGNKALNRKLLRIIQTPQVFESSLLKQAYTQEFAPLFTDDASVLESLGIAINLVQGNTENIKITNPMDLIIATDWLQNLLRNETGNSVT